MLCRTVILSLNLTTEDCLEEHNHNSTTSSVTAAQGSIILTWGNTVCICGLLYRQNGLSINHKYLCCPLKVMSINTPMSNK